MASGDRIELLTAGTFEEAMDSVAQESTVQTINTNVNTANTNINTIKSTVSTINTSASAIQTSVGATSAAPSVTSAGGVVNTVGIRTFLLPLSFKPFSTLSVQSFSCCKLM